METIQWGFFYGWRRCGHICHPSNCSGGMKSSDDCANSMYLFVMKLLMLAFVWYSSKCIWTMFFFQVRLTPTLEVYAQLSKPDGVREGSMPYTAWKCTTQSRSSSSGMLWLEFTNFMCEAAWKKMNLLQTIVLQMWQNEFHCLLLHGIGKFKLQSWLNQSWKYLEHGLLTVQP